MADIWVIGHDGHDLVEKDERTFHCTTCDIDIPREPERGTIDVDGSVEVEDGKVSAEMGLRKNFLARQLRAAHAKRETAVVAVVDEMGGERDVTQAGVHHEKLNIVLIVRRLFARPRAPHGEAHERAAYKRVEIVVAGNRQGAVVAALLLFARFLEHEHTAVFERQPKLLVDELDGSDGQPDATGDQGRVKITASLR
jgi:hypothetical protein